MPIKMVGMVAEVETWLASFRSLDRSWNQHAAHSMRGGQKSVTTERDRQLLGWEADGSLSASWTARENFSEHGT
jgi:hypothetical protein